MSDDGTPAEPQRVALVTGANRGIGFETSRQLAHKGYRVLMGARNMRKVERAARGLIAEGLPVRTVKLDVTSADDIAAVVGLIEREYGRLDVLINNAAVMFDGLIDALDVSLDVVRETFEVNTFAPIAMAQACVPLMLQGGYGRIVNLSSGRGSFFKLGGDSIGYRLSKTALNGLTVALGRELMGTGILVNAVTPGPLPTRLTGLRGLRTLADGIPGVIWAATLPDDGPTAGFFKDGEPFPW